MLCLGLQGSGMPSGRVARGIFPLIADSLGAETGKAFKTQLTGLGAHSG